MSHYMTALAMKQRKARPDVNRGGLDFCRGCGDSAINATQVIDSTGGRVRQDPAFR